MIPIEFDEANTTYAKDQPEYLPLPALRVGDDSGTVITCWSLSWRETFKMFFTGKLWLTQLTFNNALQPLRPSLERPI